MLSITGLDPGLLLSIIGLALLLGVLVAVRHSSARRELRTYCLHCGAAFQGLAPPNFVGFRQMKCSSCDRADLYPMPKGMAVTYALVFTFACVSVAVRMIIYPGWTPPLGGIWVLALPAALVLNYRLSRRLRQLAEQAPDSFVPMERV
jgi:hypothetical protein